MVKLRIRKVYELSAGPACMEVIADMTHDQMREAILSFLQCVEPDQLELWVAEFAPDYVKAAA